MNRFAVSRFLRKGSLVFANRFTGFFGRSRGPYVYVVCKANTQKTCKEHVVSTDHSGLEIQGSGLELISGDF